MKDSFVPSRIKRIWFHCAGVSNASSYKRNNQSCLLQTYRQLSTDEKRRIALPGNYDSGWIDDGVILRSKYWSWNFPSLSNSILEGFRTCSALSCFRKVGEMLTSTRTTQIHELDSLRTQHSGQESCRCFDLNNEIWFIRGCAKNEKFKYVMSGQILIVE